MFCKLHKYIDATGCMEVEARRGMSVPVSGSQDTIECVNKMQSNARKKDFEVEQKLLKTAEVKYGLVPNETNERAVRLVCMSCKESIHHNVNLVGCAKHASTFVKAKAKIAKEFLESGPVPRHELVDAIVPVEDLAAGGALVKIEVMVPDEWDALTENQKSELVVAQIYAEMVELSTRARASRTDLTVWLRVGPYSDYEFVSMVQDLLNASKTVDEGRRHQAAGGVGYPNNSERARVDRLSKSSRLMAALARCKDEYYHEADEQQRRFLSFAADQAERGENYTADQLIDIYIANYLNSDSEHSRMNPEQLQDAIAVEKDRLRAASKARAKERKQAEIINKAKEAERGGTSK